MILNVKVSFVNGWFSYRTIKVFTDNVFCTSINANGNHSIEIPNDAKEIMFQLGTIYPYKAGVSLTSTDYNEGKVFVGLSLNHRGMLLSLFDSLKTNYLQSRKLSIEEFGSFSENINQKDLIILKNSKASLLIFLLSLIILVFSVVQQNNDLAPFAFLLSLSTMISTLVHFNDKVIEKLTFKTRVFTAIASFILSALFLENSFLCLRFIIVMFTLTLFMIYLKEVQNREVNV